MKKLILMTSFFLSATAMAVQSGTVCRDTSAGPDHGYTVTLYGAQAVVEEETIAGAIRLATLTCRQVPQNEDLCCDIPRKVLECVEPTLRDAGYSFSVSVGGLAGLETGVLSAVSLAGSRQLAISICR